MDVEGLLVLQTLAALAGRVKLHVEGLADALVLGVPHLGRQGLAGSRWNGDLELEALSIQNLGIDVLVRRDAGVFVDRQGARHLDGKLSVVAEVHVHHVGIIDVVPARVDNLGRRTRNVRLLGKRQGVDARQARSPLLDEVATVRRLTPIGLRPVEVDAHKFDDALSLLGLAGASLLVVGALVVILFTGSRLFGEGDLALPIGVERRVLCEIVEAVGIGRLKGSGGVAQPLAILHDHPAIVEVGVEIGLTIRGVPSDVIAQGLVCRSAHYGSMHLGLDADAVEDSQRVGLADLHGRPRFGGRDLEVAQGDERGRDLDRHDVALGELFAALDLNDDILHVSVGIESVTARTLIGMGVDEAVARLRLRIEHLVCEDE
ncbi:Uncharacterised protein [Collinsella intestinalis]|nr:Uncharacterised protein [Collinsella intestinalis]